MINVEKKSVRLILSDEDFNTLQVSSNEIGLKKSEFLRSIIQCIGAGKYNSHKNLNLIQYGFFIPDEVKKKLCADISKKLLLAVKNYPYKSNNIRKKRM
jgi:hypothetical protein